MSPHPLAKEAPSSSYFIYYVAGGMRNIYERRTKEELYLRVQKKCFALVLRNAVLLFE